MNQKGFTIIPASVRTWFTEAIDRPIDFFINLNIHPNFFTILGLIASLIGAFFYASGSLRIGGVFILLGGICDTFDGKIARKTGSASSFGAVFDSSLDRYAEFFMFFGIGYYMIIHPDGLAKIMLAVVFMALLGSIMVSYVRARAEGAGIDCKVGIMQRADRIVLIAAGSLIHEYALFAVLWIVAIFANITAVHRMYHVWRSDRDAVDNENLDESLGV